MIRFRVSLEKTELWRIGAAESRGTNYQALGLLGGEF